MPHLPFEQSTHFAECIRRAALNPVPVKGDVTTDESIIEKKRIREQQRRSELTNVLQDLSDLLTLIHPKRKEQKGSSHNRVSLVKAARTTLERVYFENEKRKEIINELLHELGRPENKTELNDCNSDYDTAIDDESTVATESSNKTPSKSGKRAIPEESNNNGPSKNKKQKMSVSDPDNAILVHHPAKDETEQSEQAPSMKERQPSEASNNDGALQEKEPQGQEARQTQGTAVKGVDLVQNNSQKPALSLPQGVNVPKTMDKREVEKETLKKATTPRESKRISAQQESKMAENSLLLLLEAHQINKTKMRSAAAIDARAETLDNAAAVAAVAAAAARTNLASKREQAVALRLAARYQLGLSQQSPLYGGYTSRSATARIPNRFLSSALLYESRLQQQASHDAIVAQHLRAGLSSSGVPDPSLLLWQSNLVGKGGRLLQPHSAGLTGIVVSTDREPSARRAIHSGRL